MLTAATKAGKRFGMLGDKFGHRVVGDLREIVRHLALGDVLERRIGQRDDLPVVVADLVHVLEAQVEVEQLAHAAQPLAHVAELGRAALQLLEKPLREDVGVDVDDHDGPPGVRWRRALYGSLAHFIAVARLAALC